jgi:hypothetical protein
MKRLLLAFGIITLLLSVSTLLGLTQSFIPFSGVANEILFMCLTFSLGSLMIIGAFSDHSETSPKSKSLGSTAGATAGFANPMSDIEVQADRYELEKSIMAELNKIMKK